MSTETIIKVELATSEALYKGAMAIRKQVFVKEQRIPESKEFDGNDFARRMLWLMFRRTTAVCR